MRWYDGGSRSRSLHMKTLRSKKKKTECFRNKKTECFRKKKKSECFCKKKKIEFFVRIRLNVFVAVSVHERSCLDGAYVRKTGIQYHNLTKLCDREKVFRIELHCSCHRQAAELELIWE